MRPACGEGENAWDSALESRQGRTEEERTQCLSWGHSPQRADGLDPSLSPTQPSLPPSHSMVSDGTVAIFISLVMFIVPSKIPGLTQDPSKHLAWGWGGSPACRHIAFYHIWQEPAKPRGWGDLPRMW